MFFSAAEISGDVEVASNQMQQFQQVFLLLLG